MTEFAAKLFRDFTSLLKQKFYCH